MEVLLRRASCVVRRLCASCSRQLQAAQHHFCANPHKRLC
ncbi:hypothetical protein E8F20_17220 [Pseudomonas sp. BN415]|nr:hypothetical protein [Pseudomonas sp. BN415]